MQWFFMDNDDYPPFMRNAMRDSVLRAVPVRRYFGASSWGRRSHRGRV
jgi:hypothetical protein